MDGKICKYINIYIYRINEEVDGEGGKIIKIVKGEDKKE